MAWIVKLVSIGAEGVDRSTLAHWVGSAAAEIEPVVRRLRALLLASARLFAHETVVPVLDPGRGRTKRGYFWAIARDDRPWGGADPPAVAYTYAPGRGAGHARALLGRYRGIVQCDGYAAYKRLADPRAGPGAATVATCWSHARRGFYDLARGGAAPIADEALRRIAALYAVEAEIRGKPPEARRAARGSRSRRLAEDLFAWLDGQLPRVPGRSDTADAIRYVLNHRHGLTRFLEDGRIDLDTNAVERALRPVTLGRKNAFPYWAPIRQASWCILPPGACFPPWSAPRPPHHAVSGEPASPSVRRGRALWRAACVLSASPLPASRRGRPSPPGARP